ncbi:hypothetical protein BD770DRAFT_413570 [Pilaira anomala]|nr:hypothetical protein BD770DRAFT_413570 [Pilaira anomala]
MSITSINVLPFEVLKRVFENIQTVGVVQSGRKLRLMKNVMSKEDLMICSTVCKTWRRVAHGLLRRKLSVTVYENELTSLANDIQHFSDRVSHIQVKESEVEMNRERASLDLLDILHMCSNLVSVEFEFNNICEYLKTLLNSTKKLDHIQCFRTPLLTESNCSHATDLLVKLQIKYKATITCFVFCSRNIIGFERSEDLTKLVDRISISSPEPLDNTSVTKLDLCVISMRITALEYILTKFKKLEILWLTIEFLESDEPLPADEVKQILQNSSKIKYVNFSINYNDFRFTKKYDEQEIRMITSDDSDNNSECYWDRVVDILVD